MPKITDSMIEFLPSDRDAIQEVSPETTIATFTSLFAETKQGVVQNYFKFLYEVAEKDPDVLQALESRTSEIGSKEWIIEGPNGEEIQDALMEIKGDPLKGLITLDALIDTMLGVSFLTGISVNEIVTDSEKIIGFNHIPSHFLSFVDAVWMPKLWTQETPLGVDFNSEKMIVHYLNPGGDPTRGYLGHSVALQYLFKKATLEDRLKWQSKYGKGFLIVNVQGSGEGTGAYDKDYETAAALVDDIYNTDGVVFSHGTEAQMVTPTQMDGEFFFTSNDDYKKNIVKIILGQTSTSDSDDSNRSTASVHMEVLEARVLEDLEMIESTINSQLLPKIKTLLGISEKDPSEFKFVISNIEDSIDESVEQKDEITIKQKQDESTIDDEKLPIQDDK